jgi:hypothetical protein
VRSAPRIRRRGAHVSWFSLKTKVGSFSQFGLKIDGYDSCGLVSKPLVRVSRFGPQNQVGYGLSVASQNRREDEDGAGHASRSSDLLHMEVSQARVS